MHEATFHHLTIPLIEGSASEVAIDGSGREYVGNNDQEHSYVVESQRARLLVAVTPAGLEGFLEDVTRTDRVDVEGLIAAAARYGITITGPAPKVSGD